MSTLGNSNTTGGNSFPSGSGRALVSRFIPVSGGPATALRVYFDPSTTGADGVKALIYSDVGGIPGSVVFISDPMVVPSGGGWVVFPNVDLAGLEVASGVPLWLGYVSNSAASASRVGILQSVGTMVMANGTVPYTTTAAGATWPGTTATYTSTIAAELTYEALVDGEGGFISLGFPVL